LCREVKDVSLEDVIQQILSARPDLKREDVVKKIEEKRRSLGGYFTDVVLARIVASELGVEPVGVSTQEQKLSIRDLVSGLNDVTVAGRVLAVYPTRYFRREDETEGKVARLLICDKTGTLRVVLWNGHASQVEHGQIRRGQIVRILHGYVREGRSGEVELHVGSKGKIEVSPRDVSEEDYPPIASPVSKIGELREGDSHITVQGVVVTKPLVREVTTTSGKRVPVATFELKDETGRIWVSAWRELAEVARTLSVGAHVKIRGGYVKRGFADQLEISSRSSTSIEILKEPKSDRLG